MQTSLVIMAAGLGSRYGGAKQLDGLGPNGELIMEYSIYDAVRAGFDQIVFIVKEEMIPVLEAHLGQRLREQKTASGVPVDLCYVVQDYRTLPDFYEVPTQRVKPFGTVHAALCAKEVVKNPFALINADDYYGVAAYAGMVRALQELPTKGRALMMAYELQNTISPHGSVTRGLCLQSEGLLTKLVETYEIRRNAAGELIEESGCKVLDPTSLVSMNFWGFAPSIFAEMEQYFHDFLRGLAPEETKSECLLPLMVDAAIRAERLAVSVLHSPARWFGVTYREDREAVMASLRRLHEEGAYPGLLF